MLHNDPVPGPTSPARPFVSIVIPVLRDLEALQDTLQTLRSTQAPPAVDEHTGPRGTSRGADCEVIVAGVPGEVPGLRSVCEAFPGARVVEARPGRARQMNAGAREASGRWLLFLHADSRPDPAWLAEIARADAGGFVWGCFRFALDDASLPARAVQAWVRHRVRLAGLPYGDQGIFVRRDVFERLGGYAELPLMEDVDLVSRLHRAGAMYASGAPVTTSARRWRRDGWVRRSLSNVCLQALYGLGISPAWLARQYAGRRPSALAVLARAPSAGGKSRLWRELGQEPDEDLLRALLLDTLDAAAGLRHADVFLVVTPPEAVGEVAALAPGVRVLAQRGDHLGDRMHAAFDDLFMLGYRNVMLVGSDIPTLPPVVLEEARRHLVARRGDPVVLGPSEDGGYFLVGLTRPHPELFAGIEWGRPDVLERTLEAAARAGLDVTVVSSWYDVDEVASLERAAAEPGGRASRTRHWWTARRGGGMGR